MQRPSDESSSSQLDLAREQRMAQQHAIEGMKETKGHAAQTRAGDYLIGYAVEDAGGLYRWRDGELERHDKVNGSRFTKPVEVRFDNVAISTGRKLS